LNEPESEDISGRMAELVPFAPPAASAPPSRSELQISFDRRELGEILRVYGQMVAAGEWRDYAIDHLRDKAVFSIFRRTSEMPLFRVEKDPALARRQGAYAVIAAGGYIMKRGHDLRQVLTVFEKQLKLVER
jgi:hypothetical protein